LTTNPAGSDSPTVAVDISIDDGTSWSNIAEDLPLDQFGSGSLDWLVPEQYVAAQSTARMRVRHGEVYGVSSAGFLIVPAGQTFYVNMADDSDFSDNQYTTAPGLNTNSGRSPDAPVASIATLLRSYQLGPGDAIYVDTGQYMVATNIVLDASVSGVRIQGPTEPGLQAILNRGNTAQGSFVFEVNGAEDVTIANLGITGAYHGVAVISNSGSSNVTIVGNDIFGNVRDGIRSESGNSQIEIFDNRIFDNDHFGVYLLSVQSLVRGNEIYSNSTASHSWLAGIYTENASNRIESNLVHSNVRQGIDARWSSQVIGNTVYGHTASNSVGIYLQGGQARDNVVHSNRRGIEVTSSSRSEILDNRIYNNTEGILAAGSSSNYTVATIRGNRIYSNATGVNVFGTSGWYWTSLIEVSSNLIYSNTNRALEVSQYADLTLVNNTIYQPVGDDDLPRQLSFIAVDAQSSLQQHLLGRGPGQLSASAIRLNPDSPVITILSAWVRVRRRFTVVSARRSLRRYRTGKRRRVRA
jgi:parallel beta-helix repeat protein